MSQVLQAHALAVILCGAGARLALGVRPPLRRARAVLPPPTGRPAAPAGLLPPRPGATAHRPPRAVPPSGRGLPALLRQPPARGAVLCLLGGCLLAVGSGSPLPLAVGTVAAPVTARRLRRRELRLLADRRGETVIAFCGAVAAEVRAGRRPEDALGEAGLPGLGTAEVEVTHAARTGGDVAAALRRAARLPGAGGLAGAAACWQVATDSGASLATGLDRVARALRSERDTREDLRAQLAGPRTTAAVLAALPAAGLLLGTALGAAPLAVLFTQPAGLLCLLVGGALEAAGLLWTAGIIRAAERSAV